MTAKDLEDLIKRLRKDLNSTKDNIPKIINHNNTVAF